jgi:Protein of unknown function (DUF1015)
MVELTPVRAYHPADPKAAGLLSPVYDTMSDAELLRYSNEPYNASTFVARPTTMAVDDFLRVAPTRLHDALRAHAYVQDSRPTLYAYGIRYSPPPDILEVIPVESRRAEYLLLGLVGRLDLSRVPESSIARHEDAFSDRVDERVKVTEATEMTFAPIMAGYTLPNHSINDLLEHTLGLHRRTLSMEGTTTPLVRAQIDGTEHRLWRIENEEVQAKIGELLAPLRIMVLDGHHRYAAAREQIRRNRPGASPLVMLVESRDRALRLLPWHRALAAGTVSTGELKARVGARFASVEPVGAGLTVEGVVAELDRMTRQRERGFLAVDGSNAWRFRGPASPDGGFDYDLLHGYLEQEFHRDPHDFGVFRSPRHALDAIRNPGSPWLGGVAFLLPGLHQEAIEERAFRTGRMMARKSTMFLPKVAEGVLFASAETSAPR